MSKIVVVARDNQYGLTLHAAMLRAMLEAAGHEVIVASPRGRGLLDRLFAREIADAVIHVERVSGAWESAGRVQMLLPNQERYPKRLLGKLKKIDCVIATTRHAEEIFADLGAKTVYTGFASEDRRKEGIAKDWNRFFHLAGGNTLKGTEDLLALWRKHPDWPELVLVQKASNAPHSVPANVTLHSGYLPADDLAELQNSCGIHLCPSRAEGWGHYILEAMSCGAVTLTTDAPPMNEHVTPETGILVAYNRSEPRHLGTNFHVDPVALESAIEAIMRLDDAQKAAIGARARLRYEGICAEAKGRFRDLFATEEFQPAGAPAPAQSNIADARP